jgi:hypothetical protein
MKALPNYFLADLPAEASLTATMVTEACRTLKRNREQYLKGRSVESLIRTLSNLGQSWLEPDYPFRQLALDQGPLRTGFSQATLSSGLDALFQQFTTESFRALLEQDLGHSQRVEDFVAADSERRAGRAAVVTAPELLAHFCAGNLPNPSIVSMALGLLLRSAQFVKAASGQSFLLRLFAHSLYELEPKLGACLEIAEWEGGNLDLERIIFEEADCVTANGSDETIAAIRRRLPVKTRFVGYGHKLSFSYISSGVLTGLNTQRLARRAASDVVAWNQTGCLSPHVIYVQNGGATDAEQFAAALSTELEELEHAEPRGELPVEEAAAIASRRAIYEIRAAHSPETKQWVSQGSTAWTVVFENNPMFQSSCLNRFIYVKSVRDINEVLESADKVRGKVSTVGLAAPDDVAQALAMQLARWGVTRVCPLGQMQNPPLTWRHDGRPALGELVTWTDWEMGS